MFDGGGLVEGEILFFTGPEKVVQDTEPIMVSDFPGYTVQPSEALGQVAVNTAEIGACFLDPPLGNGQGDVLLLHKIVALCGAAFQNGVGLLPVLVQPVPMFLHQNTALKVHGVQPAVDNGDLGSGIGGQGVENAAVGEEYPAPFLVRGSGIIYIGEPPGFAVPVPNKPDAVLVHTFDGDRLLDAARDLKLLTLTLIGGNKGFNQNRLLLSVSVDRNKNFWKRNGAHRHKGFLT